MMTSPSDTIVASEAVLEAFKHSSDYDYARELASGHKINYFDRFWNYLGDLLNAGTAGLDFPRWCWWLLGALALMAVGYLLWKNRVGLFGPRDVDIEVQEITEDDINEVDFDQLIAEAESRADYLALCRLRYLQTLKAASDASLVAWRRYKTPVQYAQEWQDEDFGAMTNHFLRIRYGHYGADAALAREMQSRQAALLARIAGSVGSHEAADADSVQEGGVPS